MSNFSVSLSRIVVIIERIISHEIHISIISVIRIWQCCGVADWSMIEFSILAYSFQINVYCALLKSLNFTIWARFWYIYMTRYRYCGRKLLIVKLMSIMFYLTWWSTSWHNMVHSYTSSQSFREGSVGGVLWNPDVVSAIVVNVDTEKIDIRSCAEHSRPLEWCK